MNLQISVALLARALPVQRFGRSRIICTGIKGIAQRDFLYIPRIGVVQYLRVDEIEHRHPHLLPRPDATILVDQDYRFSALGTLAQAYPDEVRETFRLWVEGSNEKS